MSDSALVGLLPGSAQVDLAGTTVTGMGLSIGMVTVDCANPQQLAKFWTAALDVQVQGDYGEFVFLGNPEGGGPLLGLQRVPEPRSGKNRVHVDLAGGTLADEVPRLVSLGATLIEEHEMPWLRWTVLADPEGNEFCVGEHQGDAGADA